MSDGNSPGSGSGPGCNTSGAAAICAGPTGAVPLPPAGVIPDPATQIKGSDTYQDRPPTGSPTSVTVNNYNAAGGQAQSGAQPTDISQQNGSGGDPAPSGSTSSPTKLYDGGADCSTPPACSGDVLLCGLAKTDWSTTCASNEALHALHDDVTVHTLFDNIDNSPGSDVDVGKVMVNDDDDGSSILDQLDGSGFLGGGSCPLDGKTVEVEGNVLVDWAPLCDGAGLLGDAILALAYAFGLIIAVRGKR